VPLSYMLNHKKPLGTTQTDSGIEVVDLADQSSIGKWMHK